MTFWIVALLLVASLAAALLFSRIRLSTSAQAHGEPDGSWAIAAGAQFGPLAIAAVAARHITPILTVRIFGRELMRRTLRERSASTEPQKPKKDSAPPDKPLPEHKRENAGIVEHFKRRIDWIDLFAKVIAERRRFEIGSLDVDLVYSFADVALTGQIMGGIYALSAILPRRVRISQTPRWEFVDRFQVSLDGYMDVRLGLLVWDAICYVMTVLMRKSPRVPQGASHLP